MRPQTSTQAPVSASIWRIRFWYGLLLLCLVTCIIRLFYLQVIRHDYYQKNALQTQLKQYVIAPERGIIEAQNGQSTVPIVLNETLYTLYADPSYITEPRKVADDIQKIIGGDTGKYESAIKDSPSKRYAVLAKKITKTQKESIEKLKLKGVGLQEVPYRTYPQGSLAAQLLGFVDDEGTGKYGIEQALDTELKGTSGQLKAITDAQGVPLATNKDNVLIEPKQGDRVVLTIDIGMQQQLEETLKAGLDAANSKSGSALIMEAKTGAIKAVANYPSFNPADFRSVEDPALFSNAAISSPLEVGSIMKPLLTAAAIDQGVINKDTTYYDPGQYTIDTATITNVEGEGGTGTRSMGDFLQLSLNTGATWVLMQLGGGQVNQKARETWHDYMVDHYGLGKVTGVENYETSGTIPDPNDGFGLNIQYANTAFGQGMSATPLQMGAALAGVVNGGTYYKPHLIASTERDGKTTIKQPEVVREHVVSESASSQVVDLMEYVFTKNRTLYGQKVVKPQYLIGGKTGTAQITKPGGGYYDDRYNGTFMGFVGGDQPQYVIVVRVNEPVVKGFAGAGAAAPIFVNIANILIDNFNVTPKS